MEGRQQGALVRLIVLAPVPVEAFVPEGQGRAGRWVTTGDPLLDADFCMAWAGSESGRALDANLRNLWLDAAAAGLDVTVRQRRLSVVAKTLDEAVPVALSLYEALLAAPPVLALAMDPNEPAAVAGEAARRYLEQEGDPHELARSPHLQPRILAARFCDDVDPTGVVEAVQSEQFSVYDRLEGIAFLRGSAVAQPGHFMQGMLASAMQQVVETTQRGPVLAAAVELLGQLGRPPELPSLKLLYDKHLPAVQATLVAAARHHGDAGVDWVAQVLESTPHETVKEAARRVWEGSGRARKAGGLSVVQASQDAGALALAGHGGELSDAG